MNKQELISELSGTLEITKKDCRNAVDTLLEELKLILEEDNQYNQTGFGTFKTEVSKKRISYNPAHKKKMLLPEKKKVKFKASAKLKEKINE